MWAKKNKNEGFLVVFKGKGCRYCRQYSSRICPEQDRNPPTTTLFKGVRYRQWTRKSELVWDFQGKLRLKNSRDQVKWCCQMFWLSSVQSWYNTWADREFRLIVIGSVLFFKQQTGKRIMTNFKNALCWVMSKISNKWALQKWGSHTSVPFELKV